MYLGYLPYPTLFLPHIRRCVYGLGQKWGALSRDLSSTYFELNSSTDLGNHFISLSFFLV